MTKSLLAFDCIEGVTQNEDGSYDVVLEESVDYVYGELKKTLNNNGYEVLSFGERSALIDGDDTRLHLTIGERPPADFDTFRDEENWLNFPDNDDES